jgi:hypothetical protein
VIEAAVRRTVQTLREQAPEFARVEDVFGNDPRSWKAASFAMLAKTDGDRAERTYERVQEAIAAEPRMRTLLQLSRLNEHPAIVAAVAKVIAMLDQNI